MKSQLTPATNTGNYRTHKSYSLLAFTSQLACTAPDYSIIGHSCRFDATETCQDITHAAMAKTKSAVDPLEWSRKNGVQEF